MNETTHVPPFPGSPPVPASDPARAASPYDPTPILEEISRVTQRLALSPQDPTPVLQEISRLTRLLPAEDGIPLETPWHYAAINLLIDLLMHRWRDRDDFYVGGNMFIYYSARRVRNEDFKGPDFFYVSGVERRRPRDVWAVWEEGGKYPDTIIELLSPSTAQGDRTEKKDLYEQTFRTPEYFCFDPAPNQLEGWRLKNGRYQDMAADERGWLWSETLGLWLGTWVGEYRGVTTTWLRFYEADGRLVPLAAEEAAERAEAERQRADTAHAELERLKIWLAQKGIQPDRLGQSG